MAIRNNIAIKRMLSKENSCHTLEESITHQSRNDYSKDADKNEEKVKM